MAKQEFLMLAHKYEPRKHGACCGWYMSEKLDGIRCLWDGGVSRGLPCSKVPWANTEKHARFVNPPVATGLWTRYGQPIIAPDWWLDRLPTFPLDGELWMGHQNHQDCGHVRSRTPDDNKWQDTALAVFDSPSLSVVFADRLINNVFYKKRFQKIIAWILDRDRGDLLFDEEPFYKRLGFLRNNLQSSASVYLHQQDQLPSSRPKAEEMISRRMAEVIEAGGEGLMFRESISFWRPERTYSLLKHKPFSDMEGTVVGYVWGEETDKGSKLLGLMGSCRVKLDSGVEFDLSGFTDAERRMWARDPSMPEPDRYESAMRCGIANPGQRVAEEFENPKFPRGTRITFKYRELTRDGLPKEARYFRKRVD